jgi:type I restriction-modification system DNA methylase subunit
MNPEQARNLVRQTLTQSFDKALFRNFVLELLNEFDESKAFTSNKTYIKDAFKNHVDRFERLGTYTAEDNEKLDVLIVHLTKQSKLERARTAIRNFVADHLKQRDGKDAALVAFVSPTEKQWRFSYVKMEYATVEKESGKVDVKTRLTPARRFSYIVGEGESCHTAQTRFLDLLQDTDENPTLAQLEEAFSVEAVTKEFFNKYAELFEEIRKALEKLAAKDPIIRKEFDKKNVRVADFAKKLMGQIVFLYFIQKKGWLGVSKGQDWGTGPHDFLRQLARDEYGKYENFFNDILEPLFYDTLATDRGHEAWCKRFNCRIPFLNGGLFEPLADYDWRKTDILLPNRLFTNNDRFDDFSTGTGLLDIFDRYNFTVNEAEPLEKEVAIDPEMLGKVFENLIEENLRKGLGSYYTPREIVHYMCQESLINYLDTALNSRSETIGREKRKQAEFSDEKSEQTLLIASMRGEIVPRADIETFVHLGDQISHYEAVEARYAIRMPKSIEKHARLIDDKLADITVCDPAVGSGAFPVGMMTELVRARSALTPYFNDVHDRTAYHFKRHAIQNCLYGVDIDPGAVEIAKLRLWLSLVVDEEDVKQVKPLPNLDYKVVPGDSLVGFPFKSQKLHAIEALKRQFFDETDHDKKAHLKARIDQEIAESFAASRRSLGYDVSFDFHVFFSEVFDHANGFDVIIANPPYEEVSEKTRKDYFKKNYAEVLSGHYDLYIFFFRRAFDLGRNGTTISFITPHTYIHYSQFQSLRSYLYKKSQIHEVTSRIEGVFESAVVDNAIIVLSCGDGRSDDKTSFSEKKIENGILVNMATQVLRKSAFSDAAFDLKAIRSTSRLKKLSEGAEALGDIVDSTQGIIVYEKNQGAPVDHFRKKVVDRTCKPVTRGREITKYHLAWSGRFIRYGDWLCRSREPRFFESPKVFLRQTADTLIGTYVEEPMYCIDSVHSLILRAEKAHYELKYILGILNSELGAHIYELLICETAKVFAQVKLTFLRRFPIKAAPASDRRRIIALVDRILAAKQRDAEADVSALAPEIDLLVYALYGLTPEEIAIVEGKAKALAP